MSQSVAEVEEKTFFKSSAKIVFLDINPIDDSFAKLKVVGSNPSTCKRFFLVKHRSAYVVYPVDFYDLRSLLWLRYSRVTNAMDSRGAQ